MAVTRRQFWQSKLVDERGALTLQGGEILEEIAGRTEELYRPIGDETTAITSGAGKLSFVMPYEFTLVEPILYATTAPASQAIIVDLNVDGTTMFDTGSSGVRPQIDATENSSLESSTTFAFTSGANVWEIAKGAVVSVDFDQVGSGTTGAGVKVSLVGRRP